MATANPNPERNGGPTPLGQRLGSTRTQAPAGSGRVAGSFPAMLRGMILMLFVAALAGCVSSPPGFTPTSPPAETPAPTPTPTVTHTPISITKGPTIPGETLAIGGANLELRTIPGKDLALRVGAEAKGWQIITNSEGNVGYFIGYAGEERKEVQISVLAQGPEGSRWDGGNSLWRDDNNRVTIPDILLPGGWNEEKGTAGPAHEAETVFLFKDNGNYRVGVIYSPEVVTQIPDKSNLEILPDGSGLYVADPKNYELQPGQQITRDDEGNLRLTNPDGSWQLMRTAWNNIQSPDQLYQAGAFAGPIETLPDVPYPSEQLIQDAINPFARAFGVKPEEVGDLTPKVLTDVNGKPFVVMVTGDLAATSTFDESNTPLLIATQNEKGEWGWEKATPRKFADLLGKEFGVFVDPRFNKPIQGILTDNFNLITVGAFSWDWIRRKGPDINDIDLSLADRWVNFAKQNKMSIISGNSLVYHHGLPNWLTSGSFTKEELTRLMTEHIKTVVGHYAGQGLKWIVLNEAVWYYQGRTGYENSIWYRTIGPEYIEIAFRTAREADPSARLMYNDLINNIINGKVGSEISGPSANVVFNLVRKLKQKGLVDDVGLQFHIPNPKVVPSEEEIIAQIQRYKDIEVGVYFTEVDVDIRPLLEQGIPLREALLKQADIYQQIIRACAKSEGCKGVNVWGLYDHESWLGPESKALLFSYEGPKPAFFAVNKAFTASFPLQIHK